MSTGARLIRNTTFLTIGDKIGYLLQFVFFIYFAKKYGVVPVGEYSFAFMFTYSLAMLADSGVSVYLIREVARDKTSDRQLFIDCLILRTTCLIIISLSTIVVMTLFFKEISPQKYRVILCWGIFWIFNQLADIFHAELNGHEKMGRVAALNLLSKMFSTLPGLLLIYLGINYDAVMIVFPIAGLIYLVLSIIVSIQTLGPIRIKLKSFSYYKTFFVRLLPFFISVILIELLNTQDILLLGFIKNDQSVGIYSSAIKLVTFIVGISVFVQIALAPVLSRMFIECKQELIELSEKILRVLLLSSLPMAFGLALIADKIIYLLYSESFVDSVIVLKITAWTIIAAFIQSIFSALLTAINRQREKVIYIGIVFLISTLLNIILIHYFDYLGAAIVKLATIVINLILFVGLVSKFLSPLPIVKWAVKPFLSCIVMAAFIYLMNTFSIFIVIPTAGRVYLISLLLMKTFTIKEINHIKDYFPKKFSCRQ